MDDASVARGGAASARARSCARGDHGPRFRGRAIVRGRGRGAVPARGRVDARGRGRAARRGRGRVSGAGDVAHHRMKNTIFELTIQSLSPVAENIRQNTLEIIRLFRLPPYYDPKAVDPPMLDDDLGAPAPDGVNAELLNFVVTLKPHMNQVTVFLRYKLAFHVERLRRFIILAFPGRSVDIQPCRYESVWIKYITKHDEHPYHNTTGRYFHIVGLVYQWASGANGVFSVLDIFVTSHLRRWRYLREYLNAFHYNQQKELTAAFSLPPIESMPNTPWCVKVGQWWNHFISTTGCQRRHLYLVGPPNIGKSTIIDHFIMRLPGVRKRTYLPTFEKRFAFSCLDHELHRLILIDEMNVRSFDIEKLKLLLDGRPFQVNVKRRQKRMVTWPYPVIMISVIDPRVGVPPLGLLERLEIVDANVFPFNLDQVDIPRWFPENPAQPHIRNIYPVPPPL